MLDTQPGNACLGCVFNFEARDEGARIFLQRPGFIERGIIASRNEAAIARLHGKLARESGIDLPGEGGEARLVRQRQRCTGR